MIPCRKSITGFIFSYFDQNHVNLHRHSEQGRSQDFSKGGAEVMEAKALKRKNCL